MSRHELEAIPLLRCTDFPCCSFQTFSFSRGGALGVQPPTNCRIYALFVPSTWRFSRSILRLYDQSSASSSLVMMTEFSRQGNALLNPSIFSPGETLGCIPTRAGPRLPAGATSSPPSRVRGCRRDGLH